MSNYKNKKSRPFGDDSKHSLMSSSIPLSLSTRYEKSSEALAPLANQKESPTDSVDKDKPEEKSTEPHKPEIVEDANILGAKLLKAELMGDEDLVKSLKIKLDAAQKFAESVKKEQTVIDEEKILEQLNPYHSSYKKNKKHSKHNKHRKEKNEEVQKIMSRNYQGPNSDDEAQSKKKQKTSHQSNLGDDLDKNSSKPNVVENCGHCFDNAKKHLIVSIGKYSYLAIPSIESITEGNCYIIPINHCSSSVTCDEEVWAEIQEFRKALVKMFEQKRIDCIFYEQHSVSKKFNHMVIECVPLNQSCSNLAPIYFKKAILESESEWAQNKSIIDLKQKDLRKTIPRNMPYFTVDFGLDNGYAHIIENDESFPEYFAKEIIGGILDLDPLTWRRPKKEEFSKQSNKVIEFLKWWKSYDFNKN